MHSHSYESELNLHVNGISFSYERTGTETRFEKEAQGNPEVASCACLPDKHKARSRRWCFSRRTELIISVKKLNRALVIQANTASRESRSTCSKEKYPFMTFHANLGSISDSFPEQRLVIRALCKPGPSVISFSRLERS